MGTVEETISYYKQELSLSQQLLAITESIRRLTRKGKVEQIVARIKKREDIINQLKIIEKRLSPKRKNQISLKRSITNHDENSMQSLINNITKVIEKVNALDREIGTFFISESEKVARELKKVSTGHKLIKKYLPPRTDHPQYFSFSI